VGVDAADRELYERNARAADEEPSADRIAELADLAERDGVTTVFRGARLA
jgi:hypothetical protein